MHTYRDTHTDRQIHLPSQAGPEERERGSGREREREEEQEGLLDFRGLSQDNYYSYGD